MQEILPPVELYQPARWPCYALLAAAVALMGLLFWLVLRALRQPEFIPPPPAVPPHEAAEEALARLDERFEAVELARILRTYLHSRFGVRTESATTEELLASVRIAARLTPAQDELLAAALGHCDRLMFAGAPPTIEAVAACREFVLQTRLELVVSTGSMLFDSRV